MTEHKHTDKHTHKFLIPFSQLRANTIALFNMIKFKLNTDQKFKKFFIAGVCTFTVLFILLIAVLSRPGSIFGFFRGEYTSGFIDDIRIYPVNMVSEIENTSPRDSFKEGEPILASFTIKASEAELELVWQLSDKDGNTLRKSAFPINGTTDSKEKLHRYAMIVMNETTAIEPGTYTFTVKDGKTDRNIAKRVFTVK